MAGALPVVVWGDGAAADVTVAAAFGATLAGSRRFPRTTWLLAASILLGAVWLTPGLRQGDAFAALILIAAHAFCAGRRDPWHDGWLGLAVLTSAAVAGDLIFGESFVPSLFVPAAAWGAGRALRERELVAAQLAERARELEEEREAHAALSVRYERARVASELHDIVAQAISVMVVHASAGRHLTGDPEATDETFREIAGAARQAEQELGRLVALLGGEDATGDEVDLARVEELVGRAVGSGLDVTLRRNGHEGMTPAVSEIAYHVVREGLTNALRYAAGAPVEVRLSGDRATLVAEVTNAPTRRETALAGAGTGTGIAGLRERVASVGGRLEAGPTPEGGWRLSARLPRRVPVGAGPSPDT